MSPATAVLQGGKATSTGKAANPSSSDVSQADGSTKVDKPFVKAPSPGEVKESGDKDTAVSDVAMESGNSCFVFSRLQDN